MSLTISMKKGGTLDIAALRGTIKQLVFRRAFKLNNSGPASLILSKIADGTISSI